MEYGKFKIDLWRVYHVKSQSYLVGIFAFKQRELRIKLDAWLTDNPTAKRTEYRLQRVVVVVKDDHEQFPNMKAYAY